MISMLIYNYELFKIDINEFVADTFTRFINISKCFKKSEKLY